MKLFKILENQLKKENNFVTDDDELKKWVVLNKAQNFDATLIELLLEDKELKAKFFIEVDGALVLNQNLFVQFLEQKNYLNDSYTQYKNKVGLTIDGKYLKQRNEVALVWPFKDCVLEGGQSREEDKREEIFFNEILAQDEITQLLEPKVLTNAKVYDKDGQQDFKSFSRDAEINKKRGLPENTITDNLIIKGNNLLALHSLKKEFAGKVKLIYIDPPYNTGNDGFKYNDNFNHSTWLTFMKNRLMIARELLKDDGVIFVQCDDNEQAYLKVLLDEVFGCDNFIATLSVVMNLKGNQDQFAFAGTHEYIHVFAEEKINSKFYQNKISDDELSVWIEDEIGFYKKGANLKATGTNAPKEKRPNLYFPIYISSNNEISLTKLENDNLKILPITDNQDMSWRWSKKKFEEEKHNIIVVRNNRDVSLYKKQRPLLGELPTKKPKSIFYKPSYSSGNGTAQIKQLFGEKAFTFSKPEELIGDIVEISTKPNDIVLDYHLGSGTTCAVAHKMNRQYIGVEQMDYIETVAVERLKKVIGKNVKKEGELLESLEFDTGGISKSVNWQGGGAFTYLELKKHNQTFIEQIEEAKNSKTLLEIWYQMKAKSFLNYNVDIQKQNEHIEEFKQLELSQQKEHLVELLDKNQLYVNLSSINDKDFEVSETEKQVTRDFYN